MGFTTRRNTNVKDFPVSTGLTSDEARRRLEKFGPNAVPDTALHPLRRALTKFWAPVPWMLKAAIVLEMPNAWRIGALTIAGVFMGVSELVFCTGVLAFAKFRLELGIEALRTLAFVVIVFGNQATTYTNRERRRLGSARPSLWLLGSSVVDVLIASTLAICGIAMTPLPLFVVGGILVAAVVFGFILDFAKVPVFNRLRIA
jgi:hypothetical protein